MAVNKNFVVKNGLEVNESLILANASTNMVGIGTTGPSYLLDVAGGIGATDAYVTGFTTLTKGLQVGTSGSVFYVNDSNNAVGIGISTPTFPLEVHSSVSAGTTALYVFGDAYLTGNLDVIGDIVYDEVTGRNIYISGLSTFVGVSTFKSDVYIDGDLNVVGDIVYDEVTGRNIKITGLSTFEGLGYFGSNVGIGTTNPTAGADSNNTTILSAGIVTANYFYGDISNATGIATGLSAAIGVSSEGTFVGTGATIINFASSTAGAWDVESSGGIATATVTPGASIGLVIALGA